MRFAARGLEAVWSACSQLHRLLSRWQWYRELWMPTIQVTWPVGTEPKEVIVTPVSNPTPVIAGAGASYPYIEDPTRPGIRLFNDAAVQKVLDEKIAALPDGAHGAVIAHADTQGNATLSVVGKKGDHWTFVGEVDHSPKGKFSGQAEVRYTW